MQSKKVYESKISAGRWIAYDLPGNVGWIIWIVCLVMLMSREITWFSALSIIPAILMLLGVIELISERIQKLDWVLPKARLYRGFGALTIGGLLGIPVSVAGLILIKDSLCWWMLSGACLCALFAWLIFREYHPQNRSLR